MASHTNFFCCRPCTFFFNYAHANHKLNKIVAAKNFKSRNKLTKFNFFSPVPMSPNHRGLICVKKNPLSNILCLGPFKKTSHLANSLSYACDSASAAAEQSSGLTCKVAKLLNNLLSQQNVSHIFTRTPVRVDIGNFKEIQAKIKIKRYALLIFQFIVLGAHKLRARRTVCKSVFFLQRYKLLTNDSGPILA
jgi:hypothetical protein